MMTGPARSHKKKKNQEDEPIKQAHSTFQRSFSGLRQIFRLHSAAKSRLKQSWSSKAERMLLVLPVMGDIG